MRNLNKLTAAANRIGAWADWSFIEAKLLEAGRADLVKKYRPDRQLTARSIDGIIARVRQIMDWPPVWIMRMQETEDENG